MKNHIDMLIVSQTTKVVGYLCRGRHKLALIATTEIAFASFCCAIPRTKKNVLGMENNVEDNRIIELYFSRDEAALVETAKKYGTFCLRIAMNVLNVQEDAEECVNDTYHKAWKEIPPTRPDSFKAFLGRIVRNCSISKYRALHAKKRGNGMELMLSELSDCVPAAGTVEQEIEARELADYINEWLSGLAVEERVLFVRRYWYGDEVRQLAKQCGISGVQMTQKMLRLRKRLKAFLEKKGVVL